MEPGIGDILSFVQVVTSCMRRLQRSWDLHARPCHSGTVAAWDPGQPPKTNSMWGYPGSFNWGTAGSVCRDAEPHGQAVAKEVRALSGAAWGRWQPVVSPTLKSKTQIFLERCEVPRQKCRHGRFALQCTASDLNLQAVAKEVGAIMQDLTNQADLLLPGAAGSQEEASQPLKQRLAEAWKGKVPFKPSTSSPKV